MTESQFKVEPFRPADAEKVAQLFLDVYGETYPIKAVYHPQELLAASKSGKHFPFVVRVGTDHVIAYGALYRSAPYQGIYEFGQGVVSSHVRGAGIGRILFEYVAQYIQTLPGSETYFGEAVCNHTHTQKAGAAIKTLETGVEIDLMPGEIYRRDTAVVGRISVVDMFRSFVPRPHTVYVPEIYDDIIRYIYGNFDDSRTIAASVRDFPPDGQTEISVQVFEFAGVARMTVARCGSDFEQAFALTEQPLLNQKISILQVWIKSSWPWVGKVVELLRRKGYFFGGVLPRWFDVDGLLLQKVSGEPNWDGIHLYSDKAEKICRFIRNDWNEVRDDESKRV